MSDRPEHPAWWLLLLLSVAPLWRVVVGDAVLVQHDMTISDLLHHAIGLHSAVGERLAAGELPLWWPDVYSGVPLWIQAEVAPLWPLNLLYVVVEPWAATSWVILLQILLAAAGAAHLTRRLGAGIVGACFAGVAFGYGGFMVGHLKHLNMSASAAMLPWMLLATEVAVADRRPRWGWLALATALCTAGGMPQVLYMAICAVMLWVLGRAEGLWPRARGLAWALAATVVGVLVNAATLIPLARFTPFSPRPEGAGWEDITGQANLFDLATLLFANAAGHPFLFAYRGGTFAWDVYSFCGLSTVVLALFGLSRGRDRRLTALLVLGMGLSLVLMVGKATPLFGLLYSVVPGFSLWRLPERWTLVLQLLLCLSAGLGLQAMVRRPAIGAVLVGVLTLELAIGHAPHAPVDDADAWAHADSVFGGRSERTYLLDSERIWWDVTEAQRGFTSGMEAHRALSRVPIGNTIAQWGGRSPAGYVNLPDQRAHWFWHPLASFKTHDLRPPQLVDGRVPPAFQALLDRSNTRWVISSAALPAPYRRVLTEGDYTLFDNPGALPRAYVVTRWVGRATAVEQAAWMTETGVDQATVPAIATEDDGSGSEPLRAVEVVEPVAERLELDVSGVGAGWLVVTDTWSPGWTAKIDGVEAPIVVANGWQRAVELPAGARTVVFTYWPPGLSTGLAVSGVSGLVLLGWLIAQAVYCRRESSADQRRGAVSERGGQPSATS